MFDYMFLRGRRSFKSFKSFNENTCQKFWNTPPYCLKISSFLFARSLFIPILIFYLQPSQSFSMSVEGWEGGGSETRGVGGDSLIPFFSFSVPRTVGRNVRRLCSRLCSEFPSPTCISLRDLQLHLRQTTNERFAFMFS